MALAILAWLVIAWRAVPQLGGDEQVIKSVDALFTALTAHNMSLLADSAQRLDSLKREGKLPVQSARYLEGIVDLGQKQQWRAASEQLYAFMRAQKAQSR